MDAHSFDSLARTLVEAGSRRRLLMAFASSALGSRLLRSRMVVAACGELGELCDGNGECCPGLRCKKGRCRCKKGWKSCDSAACHDLQTSSLHCGACHNTCDASEFCHQGTCRSLCNGEPCANCFAPVSCDGCEPNLDLEFCCDPASICSRKKGMDDDRCCRPDEVCLGGRCCAYDTFGEKPCGGTCCLVDACCNGKCCEEGKVCARKTLGGKSTCVSVGRTCDTDEECFIDEQCVGGACCGGDRICDTQLPGVGVVCCGAGEYCDLVVCCPVHTSCNSFRTHRVRV